MHGCVLYNRIEASEMDCRSQQARIDAITWFHEFDFGNGLRSKVNADEDPMHHSGSRFIAKELESVDFAGKSVLDIGCWDGHWSFYAERSGAASVLAADDCTQNWSDGRGLLLARELLGSFVEVNQDLSIYQLSSLGRKFDVILCLGVYYHLLDPFAGFAQIRHCCHPGTLVILEGNVGVNLPPGEIHLDFSDPSRSKFLPSYEALASLLGAAYLSVTSHTAQVEAAAAPKPRTLGLRWRLAMCLRALTGPRPDIWELAQVTRPPVPPVPPPPWAAMRYMLHCRPFAGVNPMHAYRPPFGLHVYDKRFGPTAAA
jgi:tRNA (mo5U34)-methyltransferase